MGTTYKEEENQPEEGQGRALQWSKWAPRMTRLGEDTMTKLTTLYADLVNKQFIHKTQEV